MLAKLVFIHCEKSAGTSQRALLIQNYGAEKIFWRGISDEKLLRSSYSQDDNYSIIGGHISYAQFAGTPHRILFISIIREPVSRAVSLYNFFCEGAPEKNRRLWIDKGLDPSSMSKSIKYSREFRNQIRNMQCYRLSGKREYSATKHVLATENFLVGNFEDLHSFNSRLGELFDWSNTSLGLHNVAKRRHYQSQILSEPGLKNIITDLNQEDIELYRSISEHEVYEHIPDVEIFKRYFSVTRPKDNGDNKDIRSSDIVGIKLVPPHEECISVFHDNSVKVRINIINSSKIPLNAAGQNPIMVAYHWCDEEGQILEWEGTRTPIHRNVFPDESIEVNAIITPPKTLPPGDYKLRFALLQLGVCWLEKIDDSHVIEIGARFIQAHRC